MFEMYVYEPETIVPRDPWNAVPPSLARGARVPKVDREQRRQFVRDHRTCVFGYARQEHGPAMTVVYYVMGDGDELLVSTMAARGKAKAVDRGTKVSLCVLARRDQGEALRDVRDTAAPRQHHERHRHAHALDQHIDALVEGSRPDDHDRRAAR